MCDGWRDRRPERKRGRGREESSSPSHSAFSLSARQSLPRAAKGNNPCMGGWGWENEAWVRGWCSYQAGPRVSLQAAVVKSSGIRSPSQMDACARGGWLAGSGPVPWLALAYALALLSLAWLKGPTSSGGCEIESNPMGRMEVGWYEKAGSTLASSRPLPCTW